MGIVKTFEQIRQQLTAGEFEFTRHALRRAVERNISEPEICQAAGNAGIIEDYPDDKYAPSCLVLGFTLKNRPLHLQVSYADTDKVRLITLYQPDPNEWIDFSKRR
jgi:hypothetical protein